MTELPLCDKCRHGLVPPFAHESCARPECPWREDEEE